MRLADGKPLRTALAPANWSPECSPPFRIINELSLLHIILFELARACLSSPEQPVSLRGEHAPVAEPLLRDDARVSRKMRRGSLRAPAKNVRRRGSGERPGSTHRRRRRGLRVPCSQAWPPTPEPRAAGSSNAFGFVGVVSVTVVRPARVRDPHGEHAQRCLLQLMSVARMSVRHLTLHGLLSPGFQNTAKRRAGGAHGLRPDLSVRWWRFAKSPTGPSQLQL